MRNLKKITALALACCMTFGSIANAANSVTNAWDIVDSDKKLDYMSTSIYGTNLSYAVNKWNDYKKVIRLTTHSAKCNVWIKDFYEVSTVAGRTTLKDKNEKREQ